MQRALLELSLKLFYCVISMNTIKSKETNHLAFAGQTYTQHFKASMKYSWMSLKASLSFFVHAVYPNTLRHTGSDIIAVVNDTLVTKHSERIAVLSSQN
jgi:hypothetical protein